MTFNVGELQATMGVDDSGVDTGLEGILDKFKEFAGKGGAIMAAGGAAIGVGLALAIASAFETDTVTRKIQATLGASQQDSAKYGKAAGALFASNYGDSLGEVGEAVTSVVKNMQGLGKVSESVLVGIAGQVISLSKTFDQDFNAVTRTAGQLMKTGLAKNAQEALDIITKGLQSPVNAADDLLDTFDEYSTVFRSLGLSGKDALGLLSQGLQAGARDADQVADSLKEMLLRIQGGESKQAIQNLGLNFQAAYAAISKGGESAKTATDLILDQFRQLPPGAEKSAAALGLFGTKAEDAQKALGALDVSSAASDFETAFGKIAGASQDLDKTVGGSLQGAFEGVWREMTQLASDGGALLTPFLITAASAFSTLFDVISSALGFIADLPPSLWLIGAAVAVWASWSAIAGAVESLAIALLLAGDAAKGFLSSLGPLGVVLVAAGVAMAFLTDASDKNAEKVQAQNDYLGTLASTLDRTTGAITDATLATIKKQAIDSGAAETLKAAGISLDLYAKAASGSVPAQEALAAAIKKQQDAVSGTSGPLATMSNELKQAGISQDDLNKAIESGNWDDVQGKADSYGRKLASLGVDSATATGSAGGLQSALSQVAGQSSALTDVMSLTGKTAQQLAQDQADAAAMTEGTGEAAGAAYDRIKALAEISNVTGQALIDAGTAAGLTASQIAEIQTAADAARQAATPLAEALSSGSSAASEMDASIQLLQLALDALGGGEVDAAKAARAHEATIRAVGAAARDQAQASADLSDAQAALTKLTDAGTTSGAEYEAAQRAVRDAQDAVAAAADKQSDSLDQLAISSIGMTDRSFEGAGGMKNYDAAVAAATQTMTEQRQKFIDSAVAAGVGKDAAEKLADAQHLIPSQVATSYDAIRAKEAADAASRVGDQANQVPKNVSVQFNTNATSVLSSLDNLAVRIQQLDGRTVTITQRVVGSSQLVANTGGHVGALVNGWRMANGLSDGGQVPGTPPANPREDNVMASAMGLPIMLRSNEFVQPEPSVDYYGLPMMEAIRRRTFPKLHGYNDGGSIGVVAPAVAPTAARGTSSGSTSFVANVFLDGDLINARAELVVDGKLSEIRGALKRKQGQMV